MNKHTLAIAVLTAFSTQLFAEDSANIERLEIWGTTVKSSSVYVGEQAIAAKQADHLSDLLRDIPGVDVGGTHSLNQRINVRGLDDTDLEVLIDGASQNNYMFHHMGNLNINPDILESVDIQVGSNSVVHSGLGGALEFRTKAAHDLLQGNEQFGGRVLAGYNTNDSEYISVTGYGQLTDALDILVYGSTMNRNNFDDGDNIEVLGSEGTIDNIMAKVGFDIDEYQRFSVKYDTYQNHGMYSARPDMGVRTNAAIGGGEVPLYDTHYDRDTISGHYELNVGTAINLRADLYQNEQELWRVYNGSTTEGTSKNTGLTLIANSRVATDAMRHQLTYGVKWLKSENDSESVTDGVATTGAEDTDDLGVFIEDAIDFGNGLIITPGLRFNDYEKSSAENPEPQSWQEWQTAVAAEYAITREWIVHASTTDLFKGPQPGEIFINEQAGKVRNPDLRPETGNNREVGIRYNTSDTLGADEFRVAFTAFKTEIDDYIEAVTYPDESCEGCFEWDDNIGTVEIDGFEASIFYALDAFNALLTFAKSDSELNDGSDTPTPLEREVGDSLGLTLNYYFDDYDVDLRWHTQKTFSEDEKDGYIVHTLTAVWEPAYFQNNLNITLGIENLLDELYVSHASRTGVTNHPVFGELELSDYEPGRNIKLSVAYKF
ncbi:TonB-dependent receptor domain-containing protein [Aestuariibacter sp. A3R04]|uniref:TonB-dependent receptor domain-containing protein n=1 Tax=Aestuariibacter sp. A3R04 TaxID=2841571 RepID=UPI001C0950D1|nr:TonB-dependent receptor [Aestuariibacter sp. A3R04]